MIKNAKKPVSQPLCIYSYFQWFVGGVVAIKEREEGKVAKVRQHRHEFLPFSKWTDAEQSTFQWIIVGRRERERERESTISGDGNECVMSGATHWSFSFTN